jgi:hypothetical protein
MSHRITADRQARQAWMYLGKARETRRAATYETKDWFRATMLSTVRSYVISARLALHCAIIYRDMEGRL